MRTIRCDVCNWTGKDIFSARIEKGPLDTNGIRQDSFYCPLCDAPCYHLKDIEVEA